MQADPYDSAQTLARGQLPETPEGFLAFESCPGSVTFEIPENDEPAQARNHIHEMIVETLLLGDGAKIFRQSHGDDGGWPLRMSVMQEERAGRHAHDA